LKEQFPQTLEESHAGPGAEIISDESKTGPAPDNIYAHTNLAATYIMMGREKEARAAAAEILRINPKFSFDYLAKILPYKDQSQKDKYFNALRKAGLK